MSGREKKKKKLNSPASATGQLFFILAMWVKPKADSGDQPCDNVDKRRGHEMVKIVSHAFIFFV
jgi:hypothetical protein